jgi:hypothetical protein
MILVCVLMYWARQPTLRRIAARHRLYQLLELSRVLGTFFAEYRASTSLRRPVIGHVGKPAINASASAKPTCYGQAPELPRLQALMGLFIENRNLHPLPHGRARAWSSHSGWPYRDMRPSKSRCVTLSPNSDETTTAFLTICGRTSPPATRPTRHRCKSTRRQPIRAAQIINRHRVAAITIQIKSRGCPSK